eukprot:TRINITY_DN875_c0_g1_i2.p1 TRINITY_DN875_c0_g1~~TRINITY_DN875_c0_g1_i2.p1  ORF type:complete len:465 (+),score=23.32 TRINITY_DN875_c0_g1_i2:180-1397(+)
MARKQSTIIIGAGLSGLSAGCFAQKAGYNSRIFEHHHVPGGLAACWKRKGYLIDGGIHFIYGYRPGFKSYELLKALGVGSPDLYVPMEEYCTYVDEDSKVRIKIGKDVDKFAREAKALAPQDTGVIDEIVKGIRGMQGTDITSIGVSQPEGVLAKIQLLWQSRKIWKYMGKKYSQPVGEYAQLIKTPWLKSMVNNIFNPEVPVWFLFMLVSNVAINQMAYTKNGCQSFVQEIEKHYKSLGGQVQYKSTVAKILTENGKVYGIQLANGEKHTADYVISAGDGYNTIYNLLEGKYTNSRIDNRYKTWETCRPFFFASYGINREFKGEPVYTKVSLKEPIKYGPLEAKDFCLRIMNYGNFAPPGKSTPPRSREFLTTYQVDSKTIILVQDSRQKCQIWQLQAQRIGLH